jgi:hypothetical protein
MPTLTDQEFQNLRDEIKQLRLDEETLAAILFGDDHTAGKGFHEIADKMRGVLANLDTILDAYAAPDTGIMPLMNACRSACAWRGAELERQKKMQNQWHARL